MRTELWPLSPQDPDLPKKLSEAASRVRAGELVAFPTETVYGIGALAEDALLLERIYELKGRPRSKPFSWHLAGTDQVARLQLLPCPLFDGICRELLPGPLTSLLLDRSGATVGVRVPDDGVASGLIRALGGAILATSANPAGEPSARSAEDVVRYFDGRIHLVLDGGPARLGGDSTLVDLTSEPFKILRPGVYSGLAQKLEEIRCRITPKS